MFVQLPTRSQTSAFYSFILGMRCSRAICLLLQLEQQMVQHLLLCHLLLWHLLLQLRPCSFLHSHLLGWHHLLLCHLKLSHLMLWHLLLQLRAGCSYSMRAGAFSLLHSHLLLKGRAGHRPQRHRKKNAVLGAPHLGRSAYLAQNTQGGVAKTRRLTCAARKIRDSTNIRTNSQVLTMGECVVYWY